MTRKGSPRIEGYAAVAAISLLAALVLRRPELAIVAAPFALVLAVGTRVAHDPAVTVEFEIETERTLEQAQLEATMLVRAEGAVDRLELLVDLPANVDVDDGMDACALRLGPGQERVIPLTLRCARWGVYPLGDVEVRARDPFRLVVWEQRTSGRHRLKAYPRPIELRRILAPVETQAFAGSEVARARGDGVEYADIRDFVPGDRVRSINWRASARRQRLVVNERHPERNTDVVILLDTFVDVRGVGRSTLEEAVRAGTSLASRYLERRDRVGLVGFGGTLRWLQPGMGLTQRYRLIETMLETGAEPTYVWRDINLIPTRVLPPKALIIGLTPLVDPRFAAALSDLRARGFDVVVVEVDPVPLVDERSGDLGKIAHRLWILDRSVQHAKLEALGIGVARWGETGLEAALEGVRTFRRYARLARG
ncbi:MAG TPA: DUF58 domain-containing protein [Gaiellaceae bacterium]|nr:DUF58 domain-containing protein [Gaiellaceae bacterium]